MLRFWRCSTRIVESTVPFLSRPIRETTTTYSEMLSTIFYLATLGGLVAGVSVPRSHDAPTNNGFPNPNDQQKLAIAKQAGGLLPNGPPHATLGAGSTTALQLIAFNEIFETAYFSSLLQNVSDGAEGYRARNKAELVNVFKTIRAVSQHCWIIQE